MSSKFCQSEIKLLQNEDFGWSLGTKLYFCCSNMNCAICPEFFLRRHCKINTASVLGMRSIVKERATSLKSFSLMNLGSTIAQTTWTKHTRDLVSQLGKK